MRFTIIIPFPSEYDFLIYDHNGRKQQQLTEMYQVEVHWSPFQPVSRLQNTITCVHANIQSTDNRMIL